MYLIVGLGNPEGEYSNTRHNMGFNVINEISKKYNIDVKKSKFNALYGTGIIKNEKVILVKPQTYMNLSGDAVIEFMNFYNLEPEQLIVIYDDMDLEKGKIRVRKQGSSGSHNGMKSVIERLKITNFSRVRIGIGKPDFKEEVINYVIGKISKEEEEKLIPGIKLAEEAVEEIIENGIDIAMSKYN